jgi:hypothetical protein
VVIGAVGDEMPQSPAGNTGQLVLANIRDGIRNGAVVGDPVIARLPGDGTMAIAYMLAGGAEADSMAGARSAYGYAFDVASAGRAVFPAVLASRVLLPPTSSTAMPVDSALTLSVTGPGDRLVFRSAATKALRPAATLGMTGRSRASGCAWPCGRRSPRASPSAAGRGTARSSCSRSSR